MHDEDNAIGLKVKDPSGMGWTMYGDKRLLDDVDKENLNRCQSALKQSAKEIFDAWQSGKKVVITPAEFGAFAFAPVIESAFSDENIAPLFNSDGYPRVDIADRQKREYQGWWDFTYPTLFYELEESPAFVEPIHL